MPLVQKGVVRVVEVKDLNVGDKLLSDIMGYKDRILFNQGKTLNNRDIAYIKMKMKESVPKLAVERYQTRRKSPSAIKDKDGKVLVKLGDLITEEALAPLLDEGFIKTAGMTDGAVIFSRPQTWPEDVPWRIDHFNPAVKVETTITINTDIQDEPEDQTMVRKAVVKPVVKPAAVEPEPEVEAEAETEPEPASPAVKIDKRTKLGRKLAAEAAAKGS